MPAPHACLVARHELTHGRDALELVGARRGRHREGAQPTSPDILNRCARATREAAGSAAAAAARCRKFRRADVAATLLTRRKDRQRCRNLPEALVAVSRAENCKDFSKPLCVSRGSVVLEVTPLAHRRERAKIFSRNPCHS